MLKLLTLPGDRCLEALRHALKLVIAPELQSPLATHYAHLAEIGQQLACPAIYVLLADDLAHGIHADGLVGRLLMIDARAMRFETLTYGFDADNPLSGTNPAIRDLSVHK